MTEVERIEDQLKRAVEGVAWHGDSLCALLADVTAECAAAHPLANAHSIWETVLHIAAWMDVVSQRLEGKSTETPAEGDWQRVEDTSEAAWQDTLQALGNKYTELRKTVSSLESSKLYLPATDSGISAYFEIHGVIQHTLYHAGQIALLKKAF